MAANVTKTLDKNSVSAGVDPARAAAQLAAIADAVSTAVLGRRMAIETALTCLVADGHLLIEDVPGSGKTALSAALAHGMGLDFQRIQCTNDLLPADITGLSVFNRNSGAFAMREGPVFTQLLLADELNRAPSKTQSALLQAMEERAVTIDRETRVLPQPFLVIATQNPSEQIGTFDLPESQLDRFSLSMEIGRPDHDTQAAILAGMRGHDAGNIAAVIDAAGLQALQETARRLPVDDAVMRYALRLADRMETSAPVSLSVRFRTQLVRLAQAGALIAGRDFVAPDDVQHAFLPAVRHRLVRVEPSARAELVAGAIAATDLP